MQSFEKSVPRLLGHEDFMSWQRSMEAYLIVKDVWDVIEDGLQEPVSIDTRGRDRKAKAFITLCVSDRRGASSSI